VITAAAGRNDANQPTNKKILWTASSSEVSIIKEAASNPDDAKVKIKALSPTAANVTITAKSDSNPGVTATFTVKVNPLTITISPATASFTYNAGVTLSATVNATEAANRLVTWSATGANSGLAKITGTTITANAPVAAATNLTIRATSTVAAVSADRTVTVNPHSFNITFKSNYSGGPADTSQSNVTYGSTTALTANSFTRDAYTFAGWTEASNGTGTVLTDGAAASVLSGSDAAKNPNGNVSLYAQWTPITYAFQSVTADGSDAAATTTKLTLQFDAEIPGGLTAADITLSPALGKGAVTSPGNGKYELAITSGISANNTAVTVTVAKSGRTFSPVSRNVNVYYGYKATFGVTGAVQTWSAPYTGAYKFELWGGQGGDSAGGGGKGGYSYGTIQLTQGASLSLYVGGKGENKGAPANIGGAGGYNGGGAGGNSSNSMDWGGGGGGGATDVRRGGTALSNRIIVAGGGGGGGNTGGVTPGGAGGGGNTACNGGTGTVQGNGSAAGATQSGGNALGIGKVGINGNACGGGGGGYYGGNAVTSTNWGSGGGGGGSSYVNTNTGVFSSVGGLHGSDSAQTRTGNGQIVITWLP
jgi:uncharacterized repeat protein (TIGR02543 family)